MGIGPMTAIDPQAPEGPMPFPDGTLPIDPELVKNAVLNALHQVASGAASATHSAAEAKDYADAVLKLAQSMVILDPTLSQGGTPLQHDIVLKGMDGETQTTLAAINAQAQVETEKVRGEFNKDAAKQRAAAPTPSRSAVATA